MGLGLGLSQEGSRDARGLACFQCLCESRGEYATDHGLPRPPWPPPREGGGGHCFMGLEPLSRGIKGHEGRLACFQCLYESRGEYATDHGGQRPPWPPPREGKIDW